MVDAPEKIWIDSARNADGYTVVAGASVPHVEGGTEYLRSDIAERQIAELRAERDEARANHEYFATQWDDRGYALKATEAENARLRALPLKDEVERVLEPFAAAAGNFDYEPAIYTDQDIIDGGSGAKASTQVGHLRAARALLSRLRAGVQEGWRSIETAPKDGENILYRNKFRDIGFCHWDEGYDEGDQPCWWDNEADQEVCPVIWLPADILPAFPAAPSNQGGDRG